MYRKVVDPASGKNRRVKGQSGAAVECIRRGKWRKWLKKLCEKKDRIELNVINYSKECKQPSQLGNKRECISCEE